MLLLINLVLPQLKIEFVLIYMLKRLALAFSFISCHILRLVIRVLSQIVMSLACLHFQCVNRFHVCIKHDLVVFRRSNRILEFIEVVIQELQDTQS